MNWAYKDYPSIIKKAGLNGYTKKVTKYKVSTKEMTAGDKKIICDKLDELEIKYTVTEVKQYSL